MGEQMISNTDKAWASVLKLRSRASYYLAIAIISLIAGVTSLLIAVPTMLSNLGYSESADAAGWVLFGIVSLSIASTSSIAWVFTVTMANHGEVVYFSSASNSERNEEVIAPQSTIPSLARATSTKSGEVTGANEGLVKCSDCGVVNEEGQKYCRVCGGLLE